MPGEQILQGSSVTIKARVRTGSPDPWGDLADFDPATAVNITLEHLPTNTQPVTSAAMTKSATGKYYYTYQTTTSTQLGNWKARIDLDGTSDGVREVDFEVVRPQVLV